MSTNDDIRSRMVGHQIGLIRYSGGVRNKLIAHLNRVEDDLVRQIRKRADAGSFTENRLQLILRDVREILAELRTGSQAILRDELVNLARFEVEFNERLINRTVGVDFGLTRPSGEQLRTAVLSRPFQGRFLREWVADLDVGTQRRIRGAIRIGFSEGESIDDMVRRIRGTRAAGFRDGIMETTRRHAEAITRTAVNHTATAARDMLYEANSDIVKGWQFVAALDARTSEICASLDGQVFPLGEGPKPPRHPNCRSATSPVLRSASEIFGRDVGDLPEGTRASLDGQVPASTTYNEWLRGQPVAVQDEVLGPTKAKLFRDGELSMDRFVDRTGRVYNLDELRRRETEAFERAGL